MPNWANGLGGATVVVEFGFGFAPSVAIGATTFTATTLDVRSVGIDFGKSNERDDYQAGRCSILLGSVDREFDPLHLTGPHANQILPGVRCRVTVTVAGVTAALFTGYVNTWPQAYDIGGDTVVAVEATDGFAVLNRVTLPSVYEYTIRQDTPSAYFKLAEPAGSPTVVDALALVADGTYGTGVNQPSAALMVGGDGAHLFDGATSQALFSSRSYIVAPVSFECWFVCNAVVASTLLTMFAMYGVAISIEGGTGVAGEVYARVTPSIDSDSYSAPVVDGPLRRSGSNSITIGQTYHLVVEFIAGAVAPTIYLNAVSVGTTSTWSANPNGRVGWLLGSNIAGDSNSFFNGVMDDVAFYPSLLSGARVTAHYNAGTYPWAGLDTGTVISNVLDMAGWPAADRSIETGQSTVSSVNTAGRSALDVIKDIERTEQGRFFIGPDGVATFYNRHHTLLSTVSTAVQTTFGDAVGERPYVELVPDYGDTFIRNQVSASRVGGAIYTFSDAVSGGQYGTFTDTVTGLLNSSDSEIRDLANWRLSHYAQPQFRFTSLTVNPLVEPSTLMAVIRDRKLCDRVNVKRRPGPLGAPVGAPISIDVLIEGISHRISADMTWTTTYSLSPAETQAYMVFGDSVQGLFGTGRFGF